MPDLAKEYGVPPEIMAFVDAGFLEVLSENPDEKTVEFHIPSKRHTDIQGTIYAYDVTWIHPDFNAPFCHFDHETPGDLPNFYVRQDTSDYGDEHIDLETLDDLVCGPTCPRLTNAASPFRTTPAPDRRSSSSAFAGPSPCRPVGTA